MDNTLIQKTDVFSYINGMHNFLKTEVVVGDVKPDQIMIPVVIKIFNTAPNDVQNPLVVFTGVKLNIKGPPWIMAKWANKQRHSEFYELEYHSITCAWFSDMDKSIENYPEFPKITEDELKHGNLLFPGESLRYSLVVPVNEIAEMRLLVDGTISQRHLMYFKHSINIPKPDTRPLAVAFMKSFNAIEIHKLYDDLLVKLPDLNKKIVFNDITKEFQTAVQTGPLHIENVMTGLRMNFTSTPPMTWNINHLTKAKDHLEHIRRALVKLKIAMEKHELPQYILAVNELKNLSSEAIALDNSTEEIMDNFEMSDEETGYKYRNRNKAVVGSV
jgi:hypothetical protein